MVEHWLEHYSHSVHLLTVVESRLGHYWHSVHLLTVVEHRLGHVHLYQWWSAGWDTTHILYTCTSGGAPVGTRTPVPVVERWLGHYSHSVHLLTVVERWLGHVHLLIVVERWLRHVHLLTVVERWLGHYSHSVDLGCDVQSLQVLVQLGVKLLEDVVLNPGQLGHDHVRGVQVLGSWKRLRGHQVSGLEQETNTSY